MPPNDPAPRHENDGLYPYDHMPASGMANDSSDDGPGLARAGDQQPGRVCCLCLKAIDPKRRHRSVRVIGSGFAHLGCWQEDQEKRGHLPKRDATKLPPVTRLDPVEVKRGEGVLPTEGPMLNDERWDWYE